ncbi:hypothetical protein ABH944_004319 [Caballeronia udeis]|uniref:Uncharacterized protein n=1 Tax=Caballeronia udeis TaxID=1232866 RepID=A0ABW8MN55_9BURK
MDGSVTNEIVLYLKPLRYCGTIGGNACWKALSQPPGSHPVTWPQSGPIC